MEETAQDDHPRSVPRGAIWPVALGVMLAILAVGGFVLAGGESGRRIAALGQPPTATPTITPLPFVLSPVTATPLAEAIIQRQVVSPPTRTPTPTLTPRPTRTPTPTETPSPTLGPTRTPGPSQTPEPPVEIVWTEEEKNALAWLCYGEVGGMGVTAVDACLSVISTVRVRYIRANHAEPTGITEIVLAPGQFNVRIETTIPSPDDAMNQAVELYQNGLRGSCSGYYFFDSAPPQPNACVIYGYGGQWVRFFNR